MRQREYQPPPRKEWVVAIIGLAIVLGILGLLTYEAISGGESSPQIVNRVTAVTPTTGGHVVQLEVSNLGGEAAAGLTVEGTLNQGELVIETSETTLDFVPGQSIREAGLFFSEDPRQYRLELRAFGYQEP